MQNPSEVLYFYIGQAAAHLGVSIDTLRRWEEKGRLVPFRTAGGTRFYSKTALDEFKANSVPNQETEYSISGAALKLGISVKTLRRWDADGKLTAKRNEKGQRVYTQSDLSGGLRHPTEKPHKLATHAFHKEPVNLLDPHGFDKTPLLPNSKPTTSHLTLPIQEVQSPSSLPINLPQINLPPSSGFFHKLKSPATGLVLAFIAFAFMVELTILAYNFAPLSAKQFFSSRPEGSPFNRISATAMGIGKILSPPLSQILSNINLTGNGSTFEPLLASNIPLNPNVLGANISGRIMQINGDLEVTGHVNGLSVSTATTSGIQITDDAASRTLTVTANNVTLDQNLSTASSPSFSTLGLSSTKNQLTFGTGNIGTLTWTPTATRTITLPDTTGTIVLDSATQTLTNKTISGSSNTLSNIANSSLSNSKVTVTAGTNMSGGGDVSLGSSVTLSLASSPAISGVLKLADGTAAAPALTFTDDTNTGLYRLGADKIGLMTGGTNTQGVTIDSSGYVGMGTISPSATLDVVGTFQYTDGNQGANKVLTSDASGNASWVSIGTAGGITGTGTSGYVTKFTGTSTAGNSVIYDDGTNVGIGTTAPSAMLSVGSSSQFAVTSAGAVTAVGVNSGSGLIQGTGGITVTGTGNLNATGTSATNIGNSTGVLTLASGGTSAWTNTSGNLTIQTATSGTMAVDSAGALNLGTTNSTSTSLGKSGTTLTVNPTAWTATPTISGAVTMTSGFDSNAASTVAGLTVDGNGNLTVSSGTISGTPATDATALTLTGTNVATSNLAYFNSKNTSGTIFNIAYGAAATISDNQTLTGQAINLSTNVTANASSTNTISVTGTSITLPGPTNSNTSGTNALKGLVISAGSGINQSGSGGTTTFSGADITIPAITQGTGGTLTANGVLVTTPSSITTGGTANGINISPTGVGVGSLNAINIGSITAGDGTETALNISTGWDNVLKVGSTAVINGSGVVQVAAGGTNLTSYTAGDMIYASAATTLAKLAGGTDNNGKILTVTAGLPVWASSVSGGICSDCVLTSPTSVTTQTITPNNQDISSLVVRQTTYSTPTQNIFEVTNKDNTTKFFYVDSSGNVSTGAISNTTLTLTPTSDATALTLVGTNVATANLAYFNAKNLQGTILNMAYGAAATLNNNQTLTGQAINLSTNVTANASSTNTISVTGTSITLPGPTNSNTSGTNALKGLVISAGSGINQSGSGGTTTFSGADITIPAITQGTGGTLTANGVLVTTPSSITTGGTANGINISPTGVGVGSLNAVNIGSITGGDGTETALNVSTGWDYAAIFAGGNVGLGDTSPDYLLELYDATNTPTFALSDDDIGHGVTTVANTDVFFHLSSISTTDGGAYLQGIADNVVGATALQLRGIQASDPTDTVPAINIIGAKASGTGVQDLGATETIFQVVNNDNAAGLTMLGNNYLGINDATPDALLDLDSTDTDGGDFLITNTGIGLSGTVAGITSNSTTTGDILTISATALTTGSMAILTGPSAGTAGVTDAALKIASDVGNIGTSNGLISSTATFDGTTATGINLYLSSADAVAAGNTNYGIYNTVSNTGAITTQTKNVYGEYTSVTGTGGTTTTPTTNVYGSYLTTTASHATDVGTVNQYGLYIANGTSSTNGTSTKYGLYVESPTGADTNYAAIFAGGNVGIGTTEPSIFGTARELTVAAALTGNSEGIISIAGSRTTTAAFGDLFFSLLGSGSNYGGISAYREAADDAVQLRFVTKATGVGASEKMTILGNGNVGINDTTPDALLDLDSADTDGGDFLITNTGIGLSGTVAGITSNSTTTGDILTISATALTSGSALILTGPSSTGVTDHFVKITSDIGSASSLIYGAPDFSGSAVTGYGLNITGTDATANANTDYGVYSSLALTGNAAKTGVGLYSTLSTSSTTADTLAAADLVTSTSGIITTGTRSIYGLRTQPVSTAASTGGTTNVYGVYSKAAGVVGAGGTINSYGLYVANGTMDATGTSTNTGLYVESPTGADTNYAAIFAGGNVGIGTTNPLGSLHIVNNSASPQVLVYGTDNNTNSSTSFWNGQLTQIRIENSSTTANTLAGIALRGPGGNSMSGIANIQETDQLGALGFYTGGQGRSSTVPERMRIDSAGNVGIGTTNPGGTLDVRGQYSFFGSTQGYTYISNNELDFMYGSNANDAGYINWNGYQGGTTQFRDTVIGTGKGTRMATFQGSTGFFAVGAVTNPGSVISSGGNLSVGGNYYAIAAPANGAIIEGNVGIGDASPDALLDLDSTDTDGGDFLITNTGIGLSGTVAGITSNSTTTGDILTISATALTTGSALILTGPSGGTAGVTDAALKIASDVGNIGTSNGLISSTATFDGTTATGINLYLSSADAVAAGNTDYGIYNVVSNTGAITTQTKNVYGEYTSVTGTGGTTTTPTTNVYGSYLTTTASHATDVGTVNQYGLYIANGTSATNGTSTKYGLYVESPTGADTNYAAIFAGGNVGIGTTAPGYLLDVASAAATNNLNVIRVMNIGPNAGGVYAQHRSEVYSSSNDTDAGAFAALRTRGTKASPLAVISGDYLGSFSVEGQASTTPGDSYTSGIIRAEVDGDVSGTNIPTRWVFHTNNGSARAERMRLTSAGYLGIGGDTTPDALLDLDSTDTDGGDFLITNTGIGLSGTVAGITSNSTTTGDILTISATALTSGSGLVMTGPSSTGVTDHFIKITSDVGSASSLIYGAPDFSGSAVTGYGLNITGTDSTANANTDYGVYSSLALTGNAAKTGVGLYSTLSTSSTTADTLAAADLVTSTSGIITTGTRSVYGLRTQPVSTAASTGGTTNVYGVYSKAAGVVGAGGTINSYGLYVANGTMDTTGTSTNTGLYVETPTGADTNYAAIFAGGNVGIGITAPASPLDIQSSISTATLNDKPLLLLRSTANGTTNVGPEIVLGGDYHGDGTNNAGFASIQGVKENATVDNYASALRFGTRANGASMTEQMRIDSSGRMLINGTSAYGRVGQNLELNVSANYGGAALNTWSATAAEAGILDFNRSKSATVGTQTAVASGDNLGYITFRGSGGSGFHNAASIRGIVDGAVSDGIVPGALTFFTKVAGDSTGDVERMRIDNAGNVGIGTTAPAGLLDISKAISGTPGTTGPYLSLSASTFTDNNTVQSGTAASMVFNSFAAPTLAATNLTVTTTDAATVYIAGAPTNGTNETITNAYALLAVGNVRIGGASLCVKSTNAACAGAVAGTIYATNQTVQAADLAENYISSQTLEPGDIVSMADDGNNSAIVKSESSYQKNAIGIISTNPGVTMNSDAVTDSAHPNLYPVALAGRVPVKVSTENGAIAKGDFLTSSSTPGVAMKATRPGQMIGKALEPLECHPDPSVDGEGSLDSSATPQNDNNCRGKIMTFVNLSYADPNNFLASLTLDESGNLIVPNLKVTKLAINSEIKLGGTDITPLKDLLAFESTNSAQIANLSTVIASTSASLSTTISTLSTQVSSTSATLTQIKSDVDSLKLTPPETLLATGSATLANINVTSDASISGKLIAYQATISDTFRALGESFLGRTTIAGDFTVDGTMTVTGNSISTLGDLDNLGILYIQNSPLAQAVNFFNGQVTIDKNGLLIAQKISAPEIVTNKLTISTSTLLGASNTPIATSSGQVAGASIGTGKILAGQTTVVISTTAVGPSSRIFITATTLSDKPLAVTNVTAGESFEVEISSAAGSDIEFNWWIVEEKK